MTSAPGIVGGKTSIYQIKRGAGQKEGGSNRKSERERERERGREREREREKEREKCAYANLVVIERLSVLVWTGGVVP